MWFLSQFMKRERTTAIPARLSLKQDLSKKAKKEVVLSTYSRAVSQPLETYPTNNVIAEVDKDVLQVKDPPNINRLSLADALWMKTLRITNVYNENDLEGVSQRDYQCRSSISNTHSRTVTKMHCYEAGERSSLFSGSSSICNRIGTLYDTQTNKCIFWEANRKFEEGLLVISTHMVTHG